MTELVLPDADSRRIDEEFGAFLDEHPELQEQTNPYEVAPQLAATAFELLAQDATIMANDEPEEDPKPYPPDPIVPHTMLESTPQPGGAQPITDDNER